MDPFVVEILKGFLWSSSDRCILFCRGVFVTDSQLTSFF